MGRALEVGRRWTEGGGVEVGGWVWDSGKRSQERRAWGVERILGGGAVGNGVESSGGGASPHSLELPRGWWFKDRTV